MSIYTLIDGTSIWINLHPCAQEPITRFSPARHA